MPSIYDPYSETKTMGIFKEIGDHPFKDVNASQIVQRIMTSREMYEERQRVKGIKGIGEEAVKRREDMERDAALASTARAAETA
jgi:ethanolamine-phosphate cytidylyltransferase